MPSKIGTLERAVEDAWYPDGQDTVSIAILYWPVEHVTVDFFYTTPLKNKTRWLRGAKKAKKIIRKRIGEALTSDSEYLRAYALLILNERNNSKTKTE